MLTLTELIAAEECETEFDFYCTMLGGEWDKTIKPEWAGPNYQGIVSIHFVPVVNAIKVQYDDHHKWIFSYM